MSYYSKTENMNHDHSFKGKQTIESLLNEDKPAIVDNLSHIVESHNEQFRNHISFNQDVFNLNDERLSRGNHTEKEMQYIRRIYSLMALVSKQTKEIQSLRSIIEAYSQQECIHCNDNSQNRKRSKQL